MMPDGVKSATAFPAAPSFPVKFVVDGDNDRAWELAGIALNDASQGLSVQLWRGFLTHDLDTDIDTVAVSAPTVPLTTLFTGSDITEIDIAFDQNMNPFVAYMQAGVPKIYWYDPTLGEMTHTSLPAGCYDLRCTLDEKRLFNIAESDIMLLYMRAGVLYYRMQRDRYEDEYVLDADAGLEARLLYVVMNVESRLQWELESIGGRSIPPRLARIIIELCARVGIGQEQLDVADLWNIEVRGYLVASQQTPANIITQLQGIYPFDVCEHDGKIHFVGRGHDPVVHLTVEDDFADRGEGQDALKITEIQEVELLRRLTFHYKDETKGLGDNMANAERRATTINAEGDQQVEAPITMLPTEAKNVVESGINSQWAERLRYEFTLTKRHSFLTVGDVITVLDLRGDTHRIRITKMLWENNTAETEAINDAPWAYNQDWLARPSPGGGSGGDGTDVPIDPEIYVMSLPSWDNNDELGFYVAAKDMGSRGAEVELIVDGQVPNTYLGKLSSQATVGVLLHDVLPEVSGEYLSDQPMNIALIGDSAGLTAMEFDVLLQYNHLAAIQYDDGTWGVFQFEDGTVQADGTYLLTHIIQGRFNTQPKLASEGNVVVLLDDDVEFMEIPDWYKDLAIKVRAVDPNTLAEPDELWQQPVLAPWPIQQEWAPVSLSRDGDTLHWVPRPRLGVETNPLQSRHFIGYRVTYSDAFTVDVGPTVTSYTRSVPPGTTVTVAALNDITGPGPDSEEFTL